MDIIPVLMQTRRHIKASRVLKKKRQIRARIFKPWCFFLFTIITTTTTSTEYFFLLLLSFHKADSSPYEPVAIIATFLFSFFFFFWRYGTKMAGRFVIWGDEAGGIITRGPRGSVMLGFCRHRVDSNTILEIYSEY